MNDPLPTPPTLSLVSTTKVANVFPTESVPYRLCIIGEAPGADEEAYGTPFIGASGRLLDSILSSCGILRSGCFVGNICPYRPPGNEIKAFGYSHPKVLEGWETLKHELEQFGPNCILALGNTPLYFLTGKTGITSWQGSILSSPYGKVVPAIHPAAVLREYKQWVLLRFDALRARQEAESPELTLPQRNLELDLTADEICYRLDNWPDGQLLSFDIEGGLDAWPCCSVADSSHRGFIVAWSRMDDNSQGQVARALSRVLYSVSIPKVLQNSLYDRFVLAYGYNMLIRNVRQDTMLAQWEVYPELPKGLGTIASIWTREPHYKFERKSDDPNKFYEYCIKDSCVTLEAAQAMSNALSPDALRHYSFNLDLLSPLLYMEMRGIRYDQTTATQELGQVRAALSETTTRLELRAGYSLTGAKGSISSTKLKRCLYAEKGYPEQKKGRGPNAKVTTDVTALLALARKFKNDPFIADILLHRKLESIQETLEITADSDGRVRCGYNLVGTETGRLTCYTSPTGSGANLQTITKKLRKLYTADEGFWFFQCDLSGADGWTVAAHCLRHGDATMWDDYNSGLKPARIIALMYESGAEATRCSRAELKDRCRGVDDDGWLYFACKRIQHACYTENHELLTREGWKPIKECAGLEIMAFDKETQNLQFELPSHFTATNYTGDLYSFVGTALDLEVTGNHKMPYKNVDTILQTTAEVMFERSSGKLPMSGYYRQGTANVPADLIAAFQSDGCHTQRNHVTFHFKKERKVNRLKAIFAIYQVPFTECWCADGTWQCSVTNQDWVAIITHWTKHANASMLCWTYENLSKYVEEYAHWDGHIGNTGSISISSANREHLEWFATLTSLVGRGFTWQRSQVSGFGTLCHTLQINNRTFASLPNLKSKTKTPVVDIPVYCVTVPSGFVLVRRNGKISVSGNSNYGIQWKTGTEQIAEDSYKLTGTPTYIDRATFEALQRLYFLRYPGIYQWQNWCGQQVESGANLRSASGHTRTFFGRRKSWNTKTRSYSYDHETWKEFLADEPQENTTYATNMALYNLWHDRDNRKLVRDDRIMASNQRTMLIVEPLQHGHDALAGQFPKNQTDFAIPKIREWFNNKIQVANVEFVIPFEGKYGKSWGNLKEGTI